MEKEGLFHELLAQVNRLARKMKEVSEEEPMYIKVTTQKGEGFFVSEWTSWEDNKTGEKLIFFVTEDKCILIGLQNIEKIEFFAEKSQKFDESKIIGFERTLEKLSG